MSQKFRSEKDRNEKRASWQIAEEIVIYNYENRPVTLKLIIF